MVYDHLPFRPNVSMITFQGNKFLLVNGRQRDTWKFPQGGIDEGEEVVQAALREFEEELGTGNVRVIGTSCHDNAYHWPASQVKQSNHEFKGQKQSFVVLEYLGDEVDIIIDPQEIAGHRWVSREELLSYARDHRGFQNYNGKIEYVLEEFGL